MHGYSQIRQNKVFGLRKKDQYCSRKTEKSMQTLEKLAEEATEPLVDELIMRRR